MDLVGGRGIVVFVLVDSSLWNMARIQDLFPKLAGENYFVAVVFMK